MNTTMTAIEARAEAGYEAVTLSFADGDGSTFNVSIPLPVAVILAHRVGQIAREANGFRSAPRPVHA